MKAAMVLAFFGLIACSYAGLVGLGLGYHAVPAVASPLVIPYSVSTHTYSGLAPNYQLKLDTSLPGSAYASYPYAAAPTAYGYGVVKAL